MKFLHKFVNICQFYPKDYFHNVWRSILWWDANLENQTFKFKFIETCHGLIHSCFMYILFKFLFLLRPYSHKKQNLVKQSQNRPLSLLEHTELIVFILGKLMQCFHSYKKNQTSQKLIKTKSFAQVFSYSCFHIKIITTLSRTNTGAGYLSNWPVMETSLSKHAHMLYIIIKAKTKKESPWHGSCVSWLCSARPMAESARPFLLHPGKNRNLLPPSGKRREDAVRNSKNKWRKIEPYTIYTSTQRIASIGTVPFLRAGRFLEFALAYLLGTHFNIIKLSIDANIAFLHRNVQTDRSRVSFTAREELRPAELIGFG